MLIDVDDDADPVGQVVVRHLCDEGIVSSVVYRRETASTNSMAAEGVMPSTPALFLADRQTSGRGRHGRRWVSDDGTLTFSVVFEWSPTDARFGGLLPIVAGVAIARTFEFVFAPIRVRLKWPNDIHADGGKVAGILCEANQSAPGRVVVGIGVNVGSEPDLADDQTNRARSLSTIVGRPLRRYDVLPEIVGQLVTAVEEAKSDPVVFVSEFRQRCLLSGQKIIASVDGNPATGVCQGIDDFGGLLIDTPMGTKVCSTGEATIVSRRH